jgi:hypothetical protein
MKKRIPVYLLLGAALVMLGCQEPLTELEGPTLSEAATCDAAETVRLAAAVDDAKVRVASNADAQNTPAEYGAPSLDAQADADYEAATAALEAYLSQCAPTILASVTASTATTTASFGEVEPNNTLGTAQDIDVAPWTLDYHTWIGDKTTNTSTSLYHAEIYGTGDNTYDYYSFTANAGDRFIFDIDCGIWCGGSVDIYLRLYTSGGAFVNSNDDAPASWGQAGSVDMGWGWSYDSYLEHSFTTAGTYVLKVSQYYDSPVPTGADYQLMVSRSTPPLPTDIVNGSFETGSFEGWTIQTIGTPYRPWGVVTAGYNPGFGMAPTAPQDGSFDAINGFDGGGPMNFIMYQDILLPADRNTLIWQDRIQWNFFHPSPLARTFDVEIRNPIDNALIATLFSFSTGTTSGLHDNGWQRRAVDVSAFVGSAIRIYFIEHIPQSFTGPGQIEFDAIALIYNEPPVADAGEDQTVECAGPDGTLVTLDGSGSTDPDDNIATYEWYEGATLLGSDVTLDYTFALGSHTVTLVVTDELGETDEDEVVIGVIDTTPPAIDFTLLEETLWPPNHKMVLVASGISASDVCCAVSLGVEVSSNEPVNDTGDGNTEPDWEVVDNGDGTFDVWVRAERAGTGSQRIYMITATATDCVGNTATNANLVTVPHDKGKDPK